MNTNPKYFNPPKNLWLSKHFEFHFPLSSNACGARIANTLFASQIFNSGENQFVFITKVPKSRTIAVGEIVSTSEKSCKVVGCVGVARSSVIFDLVAYSVLLLLISIPTLVRRQYDQFLEVNLIIGVLFAFLLFLDWGKIFTFTSKLKHINGRDVTERIQQ